MEQNQESKYTKLDYSLTTAQERADFVANLPKEQLNNKKNLEYLANYIVMAMTPEEKKRKEILTDNRMVTVNKRETSYQGLLSKFENGEDGIYNLMNENKHAILQPKVTITKKDIEEIPLMRQLREAIEFWENQLKDALVGESVYFLKPETYMNLSGESIIALMQFFKIKPEEVLVVHDELELPCGTVSLKWSGGLGGHNGLRSTKENIGTADFWRLRFGIGRPDNPNMNIADYVLSKFTTEQQEILQNVYSQTNLLLVKALLSKYPANLISQWDKKKLIED